MLAKFIFSFNVVEKEDFVHLNLIMISGVMENKKFVIKEFSDDIHQATELIESSIRAPEGTQVLIKNKYVGINALYDRELYRGAVPYIDVKFPFVFGVESAGEVINVGNKVTKFKKGDSVGTVKVGTAYQEYQLVNENEVITFPAVTPEHLTLSPTGVSALLALEKLAELRSGETVVISAAAGGLGHILAQLCKMRGCKVIAICGGPHKKHLLASLTCCDQIIDYKNEKLDDIIVQKYANKIDVAIDSVGRSMFDLFLKNLAPKGRLIVMGVASELSNSQFEIVSQPRVYESIYWKGASVRCFMNHLYKEDHEAARQQLFQWYEDDDLQVKVDQTIFEGIESIKDASEYLLAGKSCGKVIVKL